MKKFAEDLEIWFINHPLIGFLFVAIVGGVVAHIRMYEEAKIEMTGGQHLWGVGRRAISSGFAGLLVYFAWQNMGWSQAWGYFMAGIVGLFATEATEFAWFAVRKWAAKRAGVELPEGRRPL